MSVKTTPLMDEAILRVPVCYALTEREAARCPRIARAEACAYALRVCGLTATTEGLQDPDLTT
jgi:hypothetical protein